MKRTAKQIQGRPYVSPRTFFDEGCSEFNNKPLSYKTDRLIEYVKSGYSLKKWIIEYRNYYNDGYHKHMNGYLELALNFYIHFFKTNEIKSFFDEQAYSDDLQELIVLLETAIKEAIKKQPGYVPPKTRKSGNKKFHAIKIKALMNSYIHQRADYGKLSEDINLDFNKDISALLEQRDKQEKLDFPNSYVHLKSLLIQNLFYAMKEDYYEDLFPQMGCSKNQFYYLKLFADKTRNKSNAFKKEVATAMALQLIKIIYFNGKHIPKFLQND